MINIFIRFFVNSKMYTVFKKCGLKTKVCKSVLYIMIGINGSPNLPMTQMV